MGDTTPIPQTKSQPERIVQRFAKRRGQIWSMAMRASTRLTNAFSKKVENHGHALARYLVWYNFCRIHKTLRLIPAMPAGVTDKLMSMEDMMIKDAAPKPGPRGPYKKRDGARISN